MSDAGNGGGRRSHDVRVGRIAGVPVFVSPWWFVAAVVFTLLYASSVRSEATMSTGASYVVAAAIVLLLYTSVLIHEASHVLVAKALGMRVGRVVLQLLGGVSEILEEPGTAAREYLVAAVGPMTSLLLVGVSAAFLPLVTHGTIPWLIVTAMLYSNGVIAVFNLLPGLPLDGGRVAHAAVWQVTKSRLTATVATAWIGRGIAVAIGIGGIIVSREEYNSGLSVSAFYALFIAVFIYTNASASLEAAKIAAVLPTIGARDMLRKAIPVEAQLPVAEAVRRAQIAHARALVIVDGDGTPKGLVSESAVTDLPEKRRPWVSISELSRPLTKGLILGEGLAGEALMAAIRESPSTEYLVVGESGAIRGVLSRADVGEALRAGSVRFAR